MQGFKQSGVTILYVTHSVGDLHTICEKSVWIDEGHVRYIGDTEDVVQLYRDYVENKADMASTQKRQVVQVPRR